MRWAPGYLRATQVVYLPLLMSEIENDVLGATEPSNFIPILIT